MPGVALAGARWEVEGTMWPAVCCAGRGESEVGHGCRCDNVCTCGDTLSSKRRASAFGAHLLLTIYAPVLRPSVWCPWGARVWCALSGTANWDLTHDGASAHREVNPTILVLCLCRDCVVLVLWLLPAFLWVMQDQQLAKRGRYCLSSPVPMLCGHENLLIGSIIYCSSSTSWVNVGLYCLPFSFFGRLWRVRVGR
jgi:hypothetical protein